MPDYACWMETRTAADAEWQPCEHLEPDAEPPGVFLDYGETPEDADRLVQNMLDDHLPSVLHENTDQPALQVRAWLQINDQTAVSPATAREASCEEITEAREALRLQAAADSLWAASRGMWDARAGLRKAVVKAYDDGLDLATITGAVASHLDAPTVTRFIDSHLLQGELRSLLRTHPDLARRTAVRTHRSGTAQVELLWTHAEHDAEQLRESGWYETIEYCDRDLASALLTQAREAATRLLALLPARLEALTAGGRPATGEHMAPRALEYQPVTVRRLAPSAVRTEEARTAA
ncbi:hypothetical protein [Streptomyces phaeochromogenes]|uniref:hypothetical protein n=1 Tax=Streptomyces phaeochromogenes TaxID=1923 RepID=UPI000A424E11|nr:hypothetical protein [Streptomyces phaeochromogenes]